MMLASDQIPKKLKQDAIVEAILELRFDEPKAAIQEVFLGKLADWQAWKKFVPRRLPLAEFPAQIRTADPNLRFQPLIELISEKRDRAVRFGPQVLSYHSQKPYPGWEKFKPELEDAANALFAVIPNMNIQRIGLRYINALLPDVHKIQSLSDLNMTLEVAKQKLTEHVNVNYTTNLSEDTQCTVRIATRDFVQGDLPEHTSAFVDVDVFTKDGFGATTAKKVHDWIEFAHTKEKEQFFRFLFPATIDLLRER
jgi:uncharacterized protein (TIGR04255 family)